MALPLLGGILASNQAEFVESVPLNLEPMTPDGKMSQVRMPIGAVHHATGPGIGRGGILWNGAHYRVMGSKLVSIAGGVVTIIGDVGAGGRVRLDYGFDRLAIRSNGKLFYWDGTTLTQVTDPDLGTVLDFLWMDGYFVTTDGTSLVVTELRDPTAVDPMKYGSAEEDPDMVTGVMEVRGELYAVGRYTIEPFQNAGGGGFPFQVVSGALIPFGCVSADAKCYFGESFAFVGSARDEALGVYVAGQGTATKISSRALDKALEGISDPSVIELEQRAFLDERRLLVHLPHETWVFCETASGYFKQKVWYRAASRRGETYRLRNATNINGTWFCDDTESAAVGEMRGDVSSHFGEPVEWQFDGPMIENDGNPFQLDAIELIGLPGRQPHGEKAVMFLSWSRDGETFGREMALPPILAGQRTFKMQWRPRVRFPTSCILRFRGYDTALAGFAKIAEKLS